MGTSPQILSQEYLHECLAYDPETGILTWRKRPLEHFKNAHGMNIWNAQHSGKKAGSPDCGYLRVAINGKPYRMHRLIWKMVTGHWPPAEIDHVNQDRADNRLSNLREVSRVENSRNASLSKGNASGTTGVHWNAARDKWRAQIMVGGKHIHLGYFSRKKAAVAARKAAEVKYDFHTNHGRSK